MLRFIVLIGSFLAITSPAQAQGFSLSGPEALQENGFLQFLLPRFALKTGIRPALTPDPDSADARLNTQSGLPVFQGGGQAYYLDLTRPGSPAGQKAQRFADWLLSDIGQRTIAQFNQPGAPRYSTIDTAQAAEATPEFTGNVAAGEALSYRNCGRCHVVGPKNRMQGIGSTPSFGLLRALPDWLERFQSFNTRLPHPSIIQIHNVSDPFSPFSPPANRPVELTLSQVEDILAYVATIEAADLGAPLQEN